MPGVSLLQRGGVDFSLFVLRSHQKEVELIGVQFLARTAKHTPNEQVHLLVKQFNFLTQTGVLFSQLLVFFKKLLFAQSLHYLASVMSLKYDCIKRWLWHGKGYACRHCDRGDL